MRTAAIRRLLRLGTLSNESFSFATESESSMTTLEYPTITLPDGDKRFRSLEINKQWELIYEQTDLGKRTAEIAPNGGDNDYEYWVTLKPENAQRAVLELIKDTFESQGKFKEWLDKKDIHYSFMSY